ncbi:MAG: cell division protein ZapA [Xanthomonadaceae bacterium]|jgi:cell division protein ZapA|nr:cell division protein ZapA [Xanthomonadaceae bacterium]
MSVNKPVNVRILDREYTIGVSAEEQSSLTAAAQLLDSRMREIRNENRMMTMDRVAILAALNFVHELQQLRDEYENREREATRTLETLNHQLDRALMRLPRD